MGHSGAGGKLIHEKNEKQKSRDTVPLTYPLWIRIQFLRSFDARLWLYRVRTVNVYFSFGV